MLSVLAACLEFQRHKAVASYAFLWFIRTYTGIKQKHIFCDAYSEFQNATATYSMEYNWNMKMIMPIRKRKLFFSPFTSVVVSVFSLRFNRLMTQCVGREVRFLCHYCRWKIHLKEIKYFSRHPIHSFHWFISYVIRTLSLPVFLFSSFFLFFQR